MDKWTNESTKQLVSLQGLFMPSDSMKEIKKYKVLQFNLYLGMGLKFKPPCQKQKDRKREEKEREVAHL